jgi:hypothetical protein
MWWLKRYKRKLSKQPGGIRHSSSNNLIPFGYMKPSHPIKVRFLEI